MDLQKLKQIDLWDLYEDCVNYMRMFSTFTDTDRNYRMFNGDQWEGLQIKGVEKVQLNFILPIVNYKVAVLNQNLFAINCSSENFESREFRKKAEEICKMLNRFFARAWEKTYMDAKVREMSVDSAVNDEGILYTTWDKKTNLPEIEVLNKVDVFYGNEQSEDIQKQPYIIIKQRMPVITARSIARSCGVQDEEIFLIQGDMLTTEQAGDRSKYEKDNMVTVLTRFYKENDKVYMEKGTRLVQFIKNKDTGLSEYPLTHMTWSTKKGWARGEGEVRNLIANQLEVNKTLMRRALVAKNTAYPQKVVDIEKIANPDAIDNVGGIIKVSGTNVQDVSKVFQVTQPAQMSTDVEKLQRELIDTTRNLASASDAATGQIKPESASGRAILAVQQASQQPLTDQLVRLKTALEQLARIWIDMLILYNPNGINLEKEMFDENTREEYVEIEKIPASTLSKVKATAKIDITPTSAFDRYAQEQSLENLLTAGFFNIQRLPELKAYVKALPDNSAMPKQILEGIIKDMETEQKRIAQINAQSQMMIQNVNRFLNSDVEAQASQINDYNTAVA